MRVALVAIVLAGCYSPTYQAGSACETSCPGDLVCMDGVCREPGYVPDAAIDGPPDAALDTDGDGLFDFEDNCPTVVNADQADEENDAIGNACDPCPHLTGTTDDMDGDGVGDACDPQPAQANQQLVFFDTFEASNPAWTLGDHYQRMGGQLRFDGSGTGTARLAMSTGETRFITGGMVQQISGTLPHSMSLSFSASDSGNDYFYGNFYENGDDTSISVTRADSGSYNEIAGPAGPSGAFPTGAFMMQVDHSVAAQTAAITSTLGGVSYATLTGPAGTPPLIAGTEILIYTRNIQVRYEYFVVIVTNP